MGGGGELHPLAHEVFLFQGGEGEEVFGVVLREEVFGYGVGLVDFDQYRESLLESLRFFCM